MPRQGQDKLSLGAGDKTQGGSTSSPHSPHPPAPSHSWWPTQPRDPRAKLENQALPSSSLSQLQHQITSLAATLQPPNSAQIPGRQWVLPTGFLPIRKARAAAHFCFSRSLFGITSSGVHMSCSHNNSNSRSWTRIQLRHKPLIPFPCRHTPDCHDQPGLMPLTGSTNGIPKTS